jgi:hypothetical protein
VAWDFFHRLDIWGSVMDRLVNFIHALSWGALVFSGLCVWLSSVYERLVAEMRADGDSRIDLVADAPLTLLFYAVVFLLTALGVSIVARML